VLGRTRTTRRSGIRQRILAWYLALLVFAVGATLVLLHAVLLGQIDGEVDAKLERRAAAVQAAIAAREDEDPVRVAEEYLENSVPGEGEALFILVDGRPHRHTPVAVRLDQDPALARRWARLRRPERGSLSSKEGEVCYRALPLSGSDDEGMTFVVANFVRNEREEVDTTVRYLAVVSVSVLVAAGALAWVAAGRVLRPIRSVIETARTITDTDLSRRVPVRGSGETAELSTTFNAMLDRLDSAFVTQRAFIEDAGHELRTPLTVIRGHLELLGEDPEERSDSVALVTDELDRMSRIVDDLLLLARAERPGFLTPGPVALDAVTRELHAKAGALAPRRWELEGVGRGQLVVDRQRLTQAMMNLAINAAQHSNEGDTIVLGSSAAHGEARLWVRDSGPGISPSEQERIFERFARGDGRRRSEGAGLGLAISRAIAEAHGGRIELETRPGAGSTFTVVLPL